MAADVVFDPLAILRSLNERDVRYVVVGGFAVAAHGVIRATADLDVVVERSWENAERLALALTDIEARQPTDPGFEPTPEALVRRADRRIETRYGELHVLHEVAGLPGYEELAPGTVFDVDGEPVRVCTLEDLRAGKRAAGRPKDLIDLTELEAIHGPDEAL